MNIQLWDVLIENVMPKMRAVLETEAKMVTDKVQVPYGESDIRDLGAKAEEKLRKMLKELANQDYKANTPCPLSRTINGDQMYGNQHLQ